MLWLALRRACVLAALLRARFSLDNTRVSNRLLLVVNFTRRSNEELDHGCCTCFVGSNQCRGYSRTDDDALDELGSYHSSRAAFALGSHHRTGTTVALVTYNGSGTTVALVTYYGPGTPVALEVTSAAVGIR